jgi:hypothetical protein
MGCPRLLAALGRHKIYVVLQPVKEGTANAGAAGQKSGGLWAR